MEMNRNRSTRQAWIRDEDVKPGTVIYFLSEPHLIDHIEPPEHPPDAECNVIGRARDAAGWGITLTAGGRTHIEPLSN